MDDVIKNKRNTFLEFIVCVPKDWAACSRRVVLRKDEVGLVKETDYLVYRNNRRNLSITACIAKS